MKKRTLISLEVKISGDSVCFRFIEMDEMFREPSLSYSYESKTGMEVRCYEFPEIHEHAIYLRGSRKERDLSFFVSYPWKTSVVDFAEKVIKTLQDYVEYRIRREVQIYHPEPFVFSLVETHLPEAFSKE